MATTLDSYITCEEAAEIIGVSHSTVTRYVSSGQLPYKRPGHEILIKRRDAKKFKRPRRGNPRHLSRT